MRKLILACLAIAAMATGCRTLHKTQEKQKVEIDSTGSSTLDSARLTKESREVTASDHTLATKETKSSDLVTVRIKLQKDSQLVTRFPLDSSKLGAPAAAPGLQASTRQGTIHVGSARSGWMDILVPSNAEEIEITSSRDFIERDSLDRLQDLRDESRRQDSISSAQKSQASVHKDEEHASSQKDVKGGGGFAWGIGSILFLAIVGYLFWILVLKRRL